MPIGTRLFCSKPPLESVLQPTSRSTSAVHSATGSKLTEIKTENMIVAATDAGIISKRYNMVLFEIIRVFCILRQRVKVFDNLNYFHYMD
jgi:hypothetical protein